MPRSRRRSLDVRKLAAKTDLQHKIRWLEGQIRLDDNVVPPGSPNIYKSLPLWDRIRAPRISHTTIAKAIVRMIFENDIVPILKCNHLKEDQSKYKRGTGCESCVDEFLLKWYEIANYVLEVQIEWMSSRTTGKPSERDVTQLQSLVARHIRLTVEQEDLTPEQDGSRLKHELTIMKNEASVHVQNLVVEFRSLYYALRLLKKQAEDVAKREILGNETEDLLIDV